MQRVRDHRLPSFHRGHFRALGASLRKLERPFVDDIFAYPALALGVVEHGAGIDSHATDHVRGPVALEQIFVESLRGYFGKLIEFLVLPQRIEMVVKVLSLPLRHRFRTAKKSFKIRRFSNRRLLAVEHHGGAPQWLIISYIGWRTLPSPGLFRDLDFRSAVGGRAYDLFGVHWLTDRSFQRVFLCSGTASQ